MSALVSIVSVSGATCDSGGRHYSRQPARASKREAMSRDPVDRIQSVPVLNRNDSYYYYYYYHHHHHHDTENLSGAVFLLYGGTGGLKRFTMTMNMKTLKSRWNKKITGDENMHNT